jgi:hypothetical protein
MKPCVLLFFSAICSLPLSLNSVKLTTKLKQGGNVDGIVRQIQTGRLPEISLLEKLDLEAKQKLSSEQEIDSPNIFGERWIEITRESFPRLKEKYTGDEDTAQGQSLQDKKDSQPQESIESKNQNLNKVKTDENESSDESDVMKICKELLR